MPFKTWNNRPSRTKWEDHRLLSLKRLAQCAAGACLLSSVPSAALAQAVIMERQLSFDAARTMATAALETCRKNGYRVSVTVVDNAGDVRAAYRDDGTPPHTCDASFRKAYTARTYRISTIEFAKRIASESDRPGLAMIKDALGLPGGLPIKVGNETIGGVGVAGAPGGNGDVACAEAAIEAIKEQLK
jgi:uncharacterized protein GlcG (DUF336 family)